MFTTFKEIESYVLSQNMKKRIALANAHDEPALSAVVNAKRRGVVEGTLIGKKAEIIQMLHNMGESETDYEIIDFDGEELESAKIAIKLVKEGKADIPMKGILQTSNFARAILNRETGLIPASGRRLVSQCGIFEYEGRFIMITDAAININPDVETQIGIVENALPVAKALGNDCPKVAVLSAVENVTEKMASTVTAASMCRPSIASAGSSNAVSSACGAGNSGFICTASSRIPACAAASAAVSASPCVCTPSEIRMILLPPGPAKREAASSMAAAISVPSEAIAPASSSAANGRTVVCSSRFASCAHASACARTGSMLAD